LLQCEPLTRNERRKKAIEIEQAEQTISVGQDGTKVGPPVFVQARECLGVRFDLIQISDVGREQTDESSRITIRLRHQDDSTAQVRGTSAGADQVVKIENGNYLSAIDKGTSETGRDTGERLQGNPRHHFLDVSNIQCESLTANLEDECKHEFTARP
jgi:hypothetical protein